jgi:hypothetical protein
VEVPEPRWADFLNGKGESGQKDQNGGSGRKKAPIDFAEKL